MSTHDDELLFSNPIKRTGNWTIDILQIGSCLVFALCVAVILFTVATGMLHGMVVYSLDFLERLERAFWWAIGGCVLSLFIVWLTNKLESRANGRR